MKYPSKPGEISEVMNIEHQRSYGAFMLLEQDVPESYQEAFEWLNKIFAPDFRIILKPIGSALPLSDLGSVGWKTRVPGEERQPTATEILNGETGRQSSNPLS